MIFFDENIPVLGEGNPFTQKDFLKLLQFEAKVFQMSSTMRFMTLSDEQVLKWVIHLLIQRGWPHKASCYPHVFIITRDQNFRKMSKFSRLSKHFLYEKADFVHIKVLSSRKKGGGDYRKREMFELIAECLNSQMQKLSPT